MSRGREGGRRELEKGLVKKYDLGRFLGAPKFKKPNTKPSLPLLLIAMRAGEIEIDGSGIGAQSPPLPTSYEMRFAQPGRDKTTRPADFTLSNTSRRLHWKTFYRD